MERKDLLRKLRALAEHPATPEHERESARLRIREMTRPKPVPKRPADRPRAQICGDRLRVLRARPKNDKAIPEKWPFGWTKPRVPVEYEASGLPNGGIAIGWKCPSCGEQVEHVLSPRVVASLTPPGHSRLAAHIQRMTGGEQNQLCRSCWDRWEAA